MEVAKLKWRSDSSVIVITLVYGPVNIAGSGSIWVVLTGMVLMFQGLLLLYYNVREK